MSGRRDPDRAVTASSLLRWSAAAAVVVAAHAGIAWLVLNWRPAAAAPSEPPPAVMIELAPLAVAAEPVPQEVAPGPQTAEAEPEPTPDAPEDPVKEPEAQPQPEPPPEPELPKPPQAEKAEAVLPPPPPPQSAKKRPEKVKKLERKKTARPKKTRSRQTTAPPKTRVQRADRTAAPFASASQTASRSPASWRGALVAHLNRYKRFPPGAAGSGTAVVAFTINRSGRVLSSRLIRSSGDRALDAEAVALPRRASPVPAPPPNVGGGAIALTVPVRFTR